MSILGWEEVESRGLEVEVRGLGVCVIVVF